eukprot:TRINITY_DN9261_c0_g1_i1.p1 TRINITY_DN9261_c0_g1~~TRINITY_DN9261_c0_g1_i1.p1  ORF type:complete len:160 (+),score=25.02 TRINITY_DN9261_c0_g1_i1:101-580(+)
MPWTAQIVPWSAPVTQHDWYIVPDDDARDYQLSKRYRQSIVDHSVLYWGTRYSPFWAYWGPSAIAATFVAFIGSVRNHRPWWNFFIIFPGVYLFHFTLWRWQNNNRWEYQMHKLLTWGQHEIGFAKRRTSAGKQFSVPQAERTPHDLDGSWNFRGMLHI